MIRRMAGEVSAASSISRLSFSRVVAASSSGPSRPGWHMNSVSPVRQHAPASRAGSRVVQRSGDLEPGEMVRGAQSCQRRAKARPQHAHPQRHGGLHHARAGLDAEIERPPHPGNPELLRHAAPPLRARAAADACACAYRYGWAECPRARSAEPAPTASS